MQINQGKEVGVKRGSGFVLGLSLVLALSFVACGEEEGVEGGGGGGGGGDKVLPPKVIVSTIAGTPVNEKPHGDSDGDKTTAQFNEPRGLVVDAQGNIYVADHDNYLIRKVTPQGNVTTVNPRDEKPYNSTAINHPNDITLDSKGNLYATEDSNDQQVKKVTPQGEIDAFAPASPGHSMFSSPFGIAIDAEDNLYVADARNNCIRKVTPDENVITVAGLCGPVNTEGNANGSRNVARFYRPEGIAIDSSGTLYVADSGNHCIRKVTRDGNVSTFAGICENGPPSEFNAPSGLAIDAEDNLYVADTYHSRIVKLTLNGTVIPIAGGQAGFADGNAGEAKFYYPRGIATDAAGNLYVADTANHRIRKITLK